MCARLDSPEAILTCPVSYLPCCFTASNTPTASSTFPSGLLLPKQATPLPTRRVSSNNEPFEWDSNTASQQDQPFAFVKWLVYHD